MGENALGTPVHALTAHHPPQTHTTCLKYYRYTSILTQISSNN